jgi:DNA repair protein RecO (recombination protein O)
MAERSKSHEAVALRLKETPGGTRVCAFLSREEGIVEAFIYGGPKSRLASLASPYNSGTAWTYRDPVKDLVKLTDFDPRACFPSLRERLDKSLCAAVIADWLLSTHALGDPTRAHDLATCALAALDASKDPSFVPRALVQFSWRALDAMGLRPEPLRCGECGRELRGAARYDRPGEGFLCDECAPSRSARGMLSEQARYYLADAEAMPFDEALQLGAPSRRELLAFVEASSTEACGAPLRSLDALCKEL